MKLAFLFLTALLTGVSAYSASPSALKNVSDEQVSQHFDFRAAALAKTASPTGAQGPRNPAQASADPEKEADRLIAELSSMGTDMQILERVKLDRRPKALPTYKKELTKLFAAQAAKEKSRLNKVLRLIRLQSIDGRNHEGGFQLPISEKQLSVFGPISHNVDMRERCETKAGKEICSQGWESDSYLIALEASGCHNSGCDSDSVFFVMSVAAMPAVYEGSAMEENSTPSPVVKPAYVSISIDEARALTSIPLKH